MRFAFDRSMRSVDIDGRLHVKNCRISKANVCPYYGREIPEAAALGLDPERIYNLYRDPVELAKAAPTFANLQLMLTHVPVNADDPKMELTAGTLGSDVRFEAPYLVTDLTVWSAEARALIESGVQQQLSSSYRYRADMVPGQTPDGVAFDGVMRDIIGNHVALVEAGRAGPDVIVNDSLQTHTEVFTVKFAKLLAALKSHLRPDADLKAADAAIDAVMTDGKPKSLALVRIATALKPFAKADGIDFTALAADAAVEKEMEKAEDADNDDDEDDMADDVDMPNGEPVEPGPKKGEVGAAAVDAAIKARKLVTADDAAAMVQAATIDATTKAVAAVNALNKAREDVAPLVGVVALDSAEAVYRFALDKCGVVVEGVHASAFPHLVTAEKSKRAAQSAAPTRPTIAADTASKIGDAIPYLSRVRAA